jgi:hypothetical protein
MFETLIADTRKRELALAERTINQRSEWALISRADKLEHTLRSCARTVRFAPLAR